MKNGTYQITNRLGTKYLLKAQSGALNVHDFNTRAFLRTINKVYLKEFYTIGEQIKSEGKLFNIVWFVNGILKETIPMQASYPICVHRVQQLKTSSHKIGLLKIIPHI